MLSQQPSRFVDRALFVALAIPAVTSLIWPYVLPWAVRGILMPAACLLTALTGMMNRRSLGSVAVRQRPVDSLTRPEKRKIRRLNEMGVELVVEDNRRLFANLSTMQIFSLCLAAFSLLDHTWRNLLFPREEAIYARTVSASEHSVTIGLRMPSLDMADTLSVQLCYRPQEIQDPAAWELTESLTLSRDNDWRGLTTFGGLASDTVYDYRLQSATQLYPPDAFLNFTTFGDPGMARESHFRFIFSSAAIPWTQPYRPLDWIPRNLFRPTAPQSAPASGVRAVSMAQPAWRMLGQWLDDMTERIAWAPIKFAILGDTELARSSGSLGLKSRRELERSRQFLDAQDVRNVYERLPIFPARVESPCLGKCLEPGALGIPNRAFQFGDAVFYRLAGPPPDHSKEQTDWDLYLEELRVWVHQQNGTDHFKFIISPLSLAPFFGGSQTEGAWREKVLDIIRSLTNVIVLSESTQYFAASILRHSVVEVVAPPLTQPPALPWTRKVSPDSKLAHSESVGQWVNVNGQIIEEVNFEDTDRLLAFEPHPLGPQWIAIEVDSAKNMPTSVIKLLNHATVSWSLEVVGVRQSRASKAVGGVIDGLHSLLRKLGLWSVKWV